MAKSGAYDSDSKENKSEPTRKECSEDSNDSDIEVSIKNF